MTCEHADFVAHVDVNRLTVEDDGPVVAFAADVRVECAACGVPMVFVGPMPTGVLHDQPTISVDGTELRIPLHPANEPGVRSTTLPGFVVQVHQPSDRAN